VSLLPSEYPEHEKLQAVKDESQAIGEFLDNSGYTLAKWRDETPVPRWIDSRTGTDKTPRGNSISLGSDYTIENPDWAPEGYYPVGLSIQNVLAEWFGIDLNVIEEEKRAMLDALRKANA
jgi:hypothetical protein